MTYNRDRLVEVSPRSMSLADQAYRRIRDGLRPGGPFSSVSRLAEREVARRLQMSRTPVRDALRRLVLEGLVNRTPGGGYSPKQVSFRVINEIFELRRAIEPYAARLAVTNADEDEMARLGVAAAASGAEDGRFHIAIAMASGNAVLARVVGEIMARLVSQRAYIPGFPQMVHTIRPSHAEIFSAIERRDQETAAQLMEDHLTGVYETLLNAIRAIKGTD